MIGHALVVRLDSLGDMVICGPAIRAVAATADRVTVLAGPEGAGVARLLPGVDDVITYDCPWIRADPPPVQAASLEALIADVRELAVDSALVLTSFHQSALPTALALRLAGVTRICAVSEDYPGSLLDVRVPPPADGPEPERMAAIAAAAGSPRPPGDDGRLALRAGLDRLPAGLSGLAGRRYIAIHPGAAAPARTYPLESLRPVVDLLVSRGDAVVITGSPGEVALTAALAGDRVVDRAGHRLLSSPLVDLGGVLSIAELAAVLAHADALVVGNTGPAHLAAAVGTPVVSLFSPVVPASRWAPYGVATVLLGDQHAACRGTRARTCPVPGHPCLSGVSPQEVVAAVDRIRRGGAVAPDAARSAVPV